MIYLETEEYELDGKFQELPGFDAQYQNIVDYILKITEEIWEKRAVWLIYDTYKDNIVIQAGSIKTKGVETVVRDTLFTLSAFPDRKMEGESVIWSKDQGTAFHTSHRIFSHATNKGKTRYGIASNKNVKFRTIADCVIKSNKIMEEWLVRDNLSLIEQMGFDPFEESKKDNRYRDNSSLELIPSVDINSDKTPLEHFLQSLFRRVYSARLFSDLNKFYHNKAVVHGIKNNDHDIASFQNHLIEVLNCFSKQEVVLERITVNKKQKNKEECAVRWVLTAVHVKDGFFGKPSGKKIIIRGISHYIILENKISEEWMVFDGYDILCQINSKMNKEILCGAVSQN